MNAGKAALGSALACAALLAGCGGSLESISAGHVGCSADEIEISEHDTGWAHSTWIASCHGERYYCSARGGDSGQVSCSPEGGAMAATQGTYGGETSSQRSAPRSPEDHVRRIVRRGDGGEETYIEARLRAEPFRLLLFQKANGSDASNIVTRYPGTPGRHEQCSLRLMIDGELIEVERVGHRHNGRHEEVASRIPQQVVQRMAKAERVSGRVCSDELRLDDDGQQVLIEYLTRLDEEQAWAGEAGETASPTQEADTGDAGASGGEPDGGVAGGEGTPAGASTETDASGSE